MHHIISMHVLKVIPMNNIKIKWSCRLPQTH